MEIIENSTCPALARLMRIVLVSTEIVDETDGEINYSSLPRFKCTLAGDESADPKSFPYDLLIVFLKNGCHPMGFRILLENSNKRDALILKDILLSAGEDVIDFIEFASTQTMYRFVPTLPYVCVDDRPITEIIDADPLTDTSH